jgi:DNA-directed RNA polymerase subunit RPC12/RpoP
MENRVKASLSWYCLNCKKELEDQDQHEECYFKGHRIKVKHEMEIVEQKA